MGSNWVAAGSAVLVAIIATIGVIVTARQNRKAVAESSSVTRSTQEANQRQQLIDNLSEQLDRLWPRLEAMDDSAQEQRSRITHLEQENADLRQTTLGCQKDVEDLRARIDDYADRYRVAVAYVRQLHDWMSRHLPGDLRPPDPPESLAFDLADPMHSTNDPPPPGWPPPRW